ncbi:MAG: hypothetical protein ACI3XC_06665, partial [Phascolarctobacterium sp.]
ITEFTTTLAGDTAKDVNYVDGGVVQEGVYKFTEDSNITVHELGAKAIALEKPTVIDATGKTLTLDAMQGEGYDDVKGLAITAPGEHSITADSIVITTVANNNTRIEGISVDNAEVDQKLSATIDADIAIKTQNARYYNLGVFAKGNTELVINGDMNIGISTDATNYYETSGIYAGGKLDYYNPENNRGAVVTVNGDVMVAGNGTGVLASYAGSQLNLNGNTTIMATSDGMMSVAAQSGTVNINEAGNKTVQLTGNVGLLNGAVNPNELVKDTVININLTNANSFLTGVVYDGFTDDNKEAGYKGYANIKLQEGATWTNEIQGAIIESSYYGEYSGSKLNTLAGGLSSEAAGNIFQRDSENITIDNYSGYTNIFYAHDEKAPTTMIGGDTIINKAAEGSAVTLITDNTGFTVSEENALQVNQVLNALAGKLVYSEYADGVANLSGTVKIAEGLTTAQAAAALKEGEITFGADGRGSYVYETPVDPEPEPTPGVFASGIVGTAADAEYAKAGVTSDYINYTFTETDAEGKINVPSIDISYTPNTSDQRAMVINNEAGVLTIVSSDLDAAVKTNTRNLTINGDVDISSTGVGIYTE